MTTFQILILIAILLIVAGIILAVVTVSMFFKQNMASVYDSLYNRGYTEKIEKRKNKKKEKENAIANPSSGGAKDAWTGKSMEDVNSGMQKKSAKSPNPQPVQAPPVVPQPNIPAQTEKLSVNSGETVMLDSAAQNMANSGETTLLGADNYYPAPDQTVLLDEDADDFRIIKSEQFTDSDEII